MGGLKGINTGLHRLHTHVVKRQTCTQTHTQVSTYVITYTSTHAYRSDCTGRTCRTLNERIRQWFVLHLCNGLVVFVCPPLLLQGLLRRGNFLSRQGPSTHTHTHTHIQREDLHTHIHTYSYVYTPYRMHAYTCAYTYCTYVCVYM